MGVLLQAIADFGYGLVFLGVFLDTVGLPIPGEAVLMGIGFLAFQGTLHPLPAILIAALGAAAGDSLMFLVGRRLVQKRGERLVQLYCRWSACTLGSTHCLERTEHLLRMGAPSRRLRYGPANPLVREGIPSGHGKMRPSKAGYLPSLISCNLDNQASPNYSF